jgi:hypothetical protein
MSRDRSSPVGYKLVQIEYANGEPTAASDSTTSTKDIFSNQDNSVCPKRCYRPVGLVRDSKGRLFMTSDATDEIWVLMKSESGQSTGTGTPTSAASTPSPTKNGAAVLTWRDIGTLSYVSLGLVIMAMV